MITAAGMGLTTAPSTGAIMQSLPLPKAGVGSAVNDTTREVGGALGVAVFGSIVTSRFHVRDRRQGRGPPERGRLAPWARRCSTRRRCRADAARRSRTRHATAYVHGFDTTLVIAAAVALAGERPDRLAAAAADAAVAVVATDDVELEAA